MPRWIIFSALTIACVAIGGGYLVFKSQASAQEAAMKSIDLTKEINWPEVPAEIQFSDISSIGAGADYQLVAVVRFATPQPDWLMQLPERGGRYYYPEVVQSHLGLGGDEIISTPQDATALLASGWSQGFFHRIDSGEWLLVAQTN